MNVIAGRLSASHRAWISSRAQAVVAAGLVPVLVHMLATTSVAGLLASAPFAVAAIAYALLFPSLPRPVAAWSAFVAGGLAVADGVSHVRDASLEAGDALGIGTGLGGVALLGVAASIASRRKPRRSLARRWAARFGAVLATAVTLVYVVEPISAAVHRVHAPSIPVKGIDLPVAHEEVTLVASDGVELDGRWIPSRNRRAIILVHGGNRNGSVPPRALMLARHGYGVLLYDPRRHDGFGWSSYRDVYGAIAFLEQRGFSKIGALGLSVGGTAALEAAGRDRRIDAVVSESAQPNTPADVAKLPWDAGHAVHLPRFAITFNAYRVLARTDPPEPIVDLVPRIAPRPIFLMSTGSSLETKINRVYRDRALGPVELWEMDGAPRAGGLGAYPREYEQRVVEFFDSAL